MDVNGLPFRMVSGARDFGLSPETDSARAPDHLAMAEATGHLILASEQPAPDVSEHEGFARQMNGSPAPVADPMGGYAWWREPEGHIAVGGFAAGHFAVELDAAMTGPGVPSDMAFAADDMLFIARRGAVIWHDARSMPRRPGESEDSGRTMPARWADVAVRHADYRADLLCADPSGGGWAFDCTERQLLRVAGVPLRFEALRKVTAPEFSAVELNPDPPRLTPVSPGSVASQWDVVAMACSTGGQLALLAWDGTGGGAAGIFRWTEAGFVLHGRTQGLRFPFSMAWVDDDAVALLATNGRSIARQAYVYAMDGAAKADRQLRPMGRIHPMLHPFATKFCNTIGSRPRHLTIEPDGSEPSGVRPLYPLSGARYARDGSVIVGPLDSRSDGCIWHRLYVEAAVPDGTAIDLELFATDKSGLPAAPAASGPERWSLHRIGSGSGLSSTRQPPTAAWLATPSEVPMAPALLRCPTVAGRAGLFTLLAQHSDRRVRRIKGRYLWMRVRLSGGGQATPELAAVRAYAGRRSWRDSYLPPFYAETLSGTDAAAPGAATPHDFLERMLHSFEGPLTELEGRIAQSWQLTDPMTAPEAALPWLTQWTGIVPHVGEASDRLRQRLAAAPYTAALGGTMAGMLAALELASGGRLITGGRVDPDKPPPVAGQLAIARAGDLAVRGLMLTGAGDGSAGCVFLTGGGVTRGDIVAVEGFRLRRTFATILGADLADEDDPLTLGMVTSGNSFVGDTLIVGDQARSELLALYASEIDASRRDTQAAEAFYRRLAWRVLLLLRGVEDHSSFLRLSAIAQAEVPAHVEVQAHHARHPLIVGAASLVGVDSYLSQSPPPPVVRLGSGVLGRGDYVAGRGGLDRRADGPVPPPPIAVADGPNNLWADTSFTLSGARSRAAEGRQISRYIWMWEEE